MCCPAAVAAIRIPALADGNNMRRKSPARSLPRPFASTSRGFPSAPMKRGLDADESERSCGSCSLFEARFASTATAVSSSDSAGCWIAVTAGRSGTGGSALWTFHCNANASAIAAKIFLVPIARANLTTGATPANSHFSAKVAGLGSVMPLDEAIPEIQRLARFERATSDSKSDATIRRLARALHALRITMTSSVGSWN